MEKFKLEIGMETKDLAKAVEVLTTVNGPTCRIAIEKIECGDNSTITADCFVHGDGMFFNPEFLKDLATVSDELMVIKLEGKTKWYQRTILAVNNGGILHVLDSLDFKRMGDAMSLYLYVPAFGSFMFFERDGIVLRKDKIDVIDSPVVRNLRDMMSASFEEIKSSLEEVSREDALWETT